jgi:hypothetical protein
MISAQETIQSQLISTEVHSYRLGDGNFYLHEASQNTVFNHSELFSNRCVLAN